MSRTIRFDSVGGASGNMLLGALVDLGADVDAIRRYLSTLSLEPFEITTEALREHGFAGTFLNVAIPPDTPMPHRHLSDIRRLIEEADLPADAAELTLLTFEKLANAEAAVHGTTPDKVHFHEVGAVDSIVDITGACLALHLLGIDHVEVGALPLGQGEIKTAHGVMPVPVPATVELLKGHPVKQTSEPFELVTPTGAALLMTWSEKLSGSNPCPTNCRVEATGVGFGQRKLQQRPNMIRAIMLQPEAASDELEPCLVLECNLDDTVPELLGSLSQKLLAGGALDVFTTSVQMKKQRPGTLLTVLCRLDDREAMLDAIFTESTTFGVREHVTRRTVLGRRHQAVETDYGTVRVKIGTWKGRDITTAPEHGDCVRCAEERGVAVRTVYEAALRAFTP